jgi:hypothetical protein
VEWGGGRREAGRRGSGRGAAAPSVDADNVVAAVEAAEGGAADEGVLHSRSAKHHAHLSPGGAALWLAIRAGSGRDCGNVCCAAREKKRRCFYHIPLAHRCHADVFGGARRSYARVQENGLRHIQCFEELRTERIEVFRPSSKAISIWWLGSYVLSEGMDWSMLARLNGAAHHLIHTQTTAKGRKLCLTWLNCTSCIVFPFYCD